MVTEAALREDQTPKDGHLTASPNTRAELLMAMWDTTASSTSLRSAHLSVEQKYDDALPQCREHLINRMRQGKNRSSTVGKVYASCIASPASPNRYHHRVFNLPFTPETGGLGTHNLWCCAHNNARF